MGDRTRMGTGAASGASRSVAQNSRRCHRGTGRRHTPDRSGDVRSAASLGHAPLRRIRRRLRAAARRARSAGPGKARQSGRSERLVSWFPGGMHSWVRHRSSPREKCRPGSRVIGRRGPGLRPRALLRNAAARHAARQGASGRNRARASNSRASCATTAMRCAAWPATTTHAGLFNLRITSIIAPIRLITSQPHP